MPPTRLPELIYVVEDEMAIARLIGDTLEKFGYRHEVFRTAEASSTACATGRPTW